MGSTEKPHLTPVTLTIATSDSGGGAGIQADLRTFAACRTFGVSAIAALTAQNPDGVSAIEALSPTFLRAQLDQLQGWFAIRAAKTGMLFNRELIRETACFLRETGIPTVVDPVMVASSGAQLLESDAVDTLKQELLPGAAVFTPNLDEAEVLLGWRPDNPDTMHEAARELADTYRSACLLKGGHLDGDTLIDVLALSDGTAHTYTATRKPTVNTHGSGCTLSAAIAAGLARGLSLPSAVAEAHAYLANAIQNPLRLEHHGESIAFIKAASPD